MAGLPSLSAHITLWYRVATTALTGAMACISSAKEVIRSATSRPGAKAGWLTPRAAKICAILPNGGAKASLGVYSSSHSAGQRETIFS